MSVGAGATEVGDAASPYNAKLRRNGRPHLMHDGRHTRDLDGFGASHCVASSDINPAPRESRLFVKARSW